MSAATPKDSLRTDAWLWHVRVYKTRSSSKAACISGKVRVNDEIAKPATKVTIGDRIEARKRDEIVKFEITGLPAKRIGASKVIECCTVIEKVSKRSPSLGGPIPPGANRLRGLGRPTKKERRALDKLRGIRKR